MTRLVDDPSRFREDMLTGFLDLYADVVVGVQGGVVRAGETPPGKVAVVVGGGSGHYPAFCGLVGPGLADGAVVGNVFTSPSTDDACSVGRAAVSDAGLLFVTGNYAGDVMNFELARDRLRAEGLDARTLYVTDDVASAPPGEEGRRRGVAGDLVIVKVAGAAAEAGLALDEVERLARKANDLTRTLGVGLQGCTMPGADHPLFTVPEGRMGVGLGIHGEPGIEERDLLSACQLAELLVDGVLAEEVEGDGRVGVTLNGLGATKYEELFVLWATVARLLRDRGLTIVAPEVGELVTSLDMAGVSLTVVQLDDELERWWLAPARTPGYSRTVQQPVAGDARRPRSAVLPPAAETGQGSPVRQSSPESARAAALVVRGLDAALAVVSGAEAELARLDAVAGDGDHGRGMVRGLSAAADAARSAHEQGAGAGTVLDAAGGAWAAQAGGTSGVLWGAALQAAGRMLGDEDIVTAARLDAAVRGAVEQVAALGKAVVGDKTLLDAAVPFAEALAGAIDAGAATAAAWQAAAAVATHAARDTAELRPRIGRARPLAERSVGTPDPGAVSFALCVEAAVKEVLDEG